MNCGDTFLLGDEDEPLHLHVVMTPPTNGEVVIVSVTTRRRNSETLVALDRGDHPFIQHPSVVAYRYARIETVEALDRLVESGVAKIREPVSDALLRRICAGLLDSEFTPNHVRQYVLGLKLR